MIALLKSLEMHENTFQECLTDYTVYKCHACKLRSLGGEGACLERFNECLLKIGYFQLALCFLPVIK